MSMLGEEKLWISAMEAMEPAVQSFGEEVRQIDKSIRFLEGHWAPTQDRPLGVWANLVRGEGESEETVAVSIVFRVAGSVLRMVADVDYETERTGKELAHLGRDVVSIDADYDTYEIGLTNALRDTQEMLFSVLPSVRQILTYPNKSERVS